ncbi:hypothetical protein [Streptomyces sp. ML-6]|uniref:hypothetical protein n=1 Tax=Streptomyces sp. ML-6 TaxID=2982693 RepID=UPI0024BF1107|nr:hypothetical protein [Streptomyces sp. ML-6]MDK0524027.1 hypothetical protein [Streptomyces sp. ML-6]
MAPLNLVPACSDCNHIKGDQKPTTVETTPLHPYLDRIDDVTWLQAKVIHDAPVRLEFFVTPPPTWGQGLIARATHHFTMFGLAKTYAVQANRTLRNIQHTLEGQFKAGGKELVHEYLAAEAATRLAVQPNGWEGVTYRTLAADGAFCNGGFLE